MNILILYLREQISKSCILRSPTVFIEIIHFKMHSIESKAFQVELHIDPKRMNFILNGSGFIFNFLLCMCQRDKPRSPYPLSNLLTCLPLMAMAKNFKRLQPKIFYSYHSKTASNWPLRLPNQQNSIPENDFSKNGAVLPLKF